MRKPTWAKAALTALAISAATPATAQGQTLTGRVSVIDGDTLEMHGQRIRLFAMDAPEGQQTCGTVSGKVWRCGTAAARALDDLTAGKTVICAQRDTDRYGRAVAVCHVSGKDLGQELVLQGLAVANPYFGKDYVAAEDAARKAGQGMWSGNFSTPSHRHSARNSDTACHDFNP